MKINLWSKTFIYYYKKFYKTINKYYKSCFKQILTIWFPNMSKKLMQNIKDSLKLKTLFKYQQFLFKYKLQKVYYFQLKISFKTGAYWHYTKMLTYSLADLWFLCLNILKLSLSKNDELTVRKKIKNQNFNLKISVKLNNKLCL